jgi:hypothetical protein
VLHVLHQLCKKSRIHLRGKLFEKNGNFIPLILDKACFSFNPRSDIADIKRKHCHRYLEFLAKSSLNEDEQQLFASECLQKVIFPSLKSAMTSAKQVKRCLKMLIFKAKNFVSIFADNDQNLEQILDQIESRFYKNKEILNQINIFWELL